VRVRVPPHTVFGEKVGMATLKKTVTPTVVSTVAGLGLAMLNLALTVPPVSSSPALNDPVIVGCRTAAGRTSCGGLASATPAVARQRMLVRDRESAAIRRFTVTLNA